MVRLNLIRPGAQLMRRLRLAHKLALLAVVLLVPTVMISLVLIQRAGTDIRVTSDEADGVRIVASLSGVVQALQDHRDHAHMVLSGVAAARSLQENTQKELNTALATAESAVASRPDFGLIKEWSSLRADIQAVAAAGGASAQDPFARHSALVAELRRLLYTVGERSSLLFDPEPASYFLMDLVVSRTVGWSEALGRVRGFGAGQLALAAPDAGATDRLRAQLDDLAEMGRDLRFAISFAQRHDAEPLKSEQALAASEAFLGMARIAIDAPDATSVEAYFSEGSRAMAAVQAVQLVALGRLDSLLSQRLKQLEQARIWAIGGTLLGMALMGYIMMAFYFSFVSDFRAVVSVVGETASGNLRAQVKVRGRDELAELARLVERMTGNLSAMVAEVRSNTALVANTGRSLAQGNRNLAGRTEQQAANLQETAASVQQLSGTVQQNALAAGDSDTQASKVRDVAESGAQSMVHAIESVEGIQKGTQQMNDIIGVIDSLAFQTNILALNAAVEAARAGEQGRGFAVVASEVRNLAQRSAASAKEIRLLIEASSRNVSTSVEQIRTVGSRMTDIVGGVRSVAGNMSLISAASAEQSTGLREIAQAVRQLDEITQRNAQMVEHAVSQSTLLEGRAAHLSRAVASFLLQQGTAEEAVALVQRAVQHRTQVSLDAFVRDLTEPKNGFWDRDMYVFALDRPGTYRAFGGKPEKVGSRVQDISGVDGQALQDAIVAQAESEPGWVEYDIVNPLTGAIQAKMSYVLKVDELYVGCGVYKTVAVA